MSLIPDDPLTYIEMNDLHSYLMLIKRIHYYTMIVELTCVVENQSIVKAWEGIIKECEKVETIEKGENNERISLPDIDQRAYITE